MKLPAPIWKRSVKSILFAGLMVLSRDLVGDHSVFKLNLPALILGGPPTYSKRGVEQKEAETKVLSDKIAFDELEKAFESSPFKTAEDAKTVFNEKLKYDAYYAVRRCVSREQFVRSVQSSPGPGVNISRISHYNILQNKIRIN